MWTISQGIYVKKISNIIISVIIISVYNIQSEQILAEGDVNCFFYEECLQRSPSNHSNLILNHPSPARFQSKLHAQVRPRVVPTCLCGQRTVNQAVPSGTAEPAPAQPATRREREHLSYLAENINIYEIYVIYVPTR